ncbi:hypothetical protein N0M98_30510 [Paenibacillus doosanensis]|uniref:Lipoprotein n=1 Tax=Paenibacillus konkukensis TaxID=2020716 RepID=A0ABY4RHR3_9BACL|nr:MULTISPECIES: hypothetical protein [Paenibacillus]MCS7464435.1 hypothetical protein [Paenibacillus doosanensis]UQZ81698.1 hypothetical protein SK3146_00854 [Paenibacillus konkukensis]
MNNRCLRTIGLVISVAAMLSGCEPDHSAADARSLAPVQKEEDVQSDMERDMVLLFQSLVQMDKQAQLTINRKQAEQMLPVVQRNTRTGELTQADRQDIIDLLTNEQRRFVSDYRERAHARMKAARDSKPFDGLSQEEREKMVQEFQKRRRQEREEEGQAAEPVPQAQADTPVTGDQRRTGNVEQRLIRLLEGKLPQP